MSDQHYCETHPHDIQGNGYCVHGCGTYRPPTGTPNHADGTSH
jgi:hypothetical protein